jgi:hypothetical protein
VLEAARVVVATARRLAMPAENAMVNGDLRRARVALWDLREILGASTAAGTSANDQDREPDSAECR